MPQIADRYAIKRRYIMAKYSIELDCPPGYPRPGDLLPRVLEGTGLSPENFHNTGRLFGNWTFELPDGQNKNEVYEKARDTIKQRITELYNSGAIRYGSW
jgi:hypothetical protein